MKKCCLFFLLIFLLSYPSFAQIVGTDVFLQGQWLEIGVDKMGAFGTCSSPATYHVHACCGSTICTTSGAAMDASYDWGHDGWTVGTPCLMGPYTQPGYPQEGWSIEVAGTEYRNWAGGGLCTGPFDVTGGITGYSNTGGTAKGIFTGTVAGLNIIQETRVDTEASWVVVTTRIYNTTASPITGVYYERTCDPDNSSDWGGGSTTENIILHQNEDDKHEVEVGTYSNSGVYNMYDTWMALATKDCRASCGILTGGLYPTGTPSSLIGSGGTLLDSNFEDVGVWLIYNIGTLAPLGSPGDSAIVSYAYIYDSRSGIDSAFPEPQLEVNGTLIQPSGSAPAPTYDTVNACTTPLTTISVQVNNATDKCWSWSTWTWSPATALATTTGVVNTITIAALPAGFTTYTITGTDSASNMFSCNNRVMYVTVFKPLLGLTVTNNSPICSGNTLMLSAAPDSVGDTFNWIGPNSFTSTLSDPSITPVIVRDGGLYRVIRNFHSCLDTGYTTVIVDSTPAVPTISNNTPICSGPKDTLLLTSSDVTPGISYSWTGPAGFTSALQNPILPDASVPESGTYTVTAAINYDGLICSSQNTTIAVIDSTPYLPLLGSNAPICSGTSLLLTSTTTNLAPAFTTIYSWTGPDAFVSGLQNPAVNPATTSATGVYTVTATIIYPGIPAGCTSDTATLTVVVDSTPVTPIANNNSPGPPSICQGDTLILTSSDATAGVSYRWVGPDGFTSTMQNPTDIINVMPAATGVYTLTVSLGMCSSSAVTTVTITPTPILTGTNNGPVCTGAADTLFLQATGNPAATFSWAGPYTFVSNAQNPYRTPVIMEYGGIYQVTAYLNGCPSLPVNDTVVVRQTPAPPWVTWLTYCQNSAVPPLQAFGDSVLWYPSSAPGAAGSLTPPIPATSSDTVMWFYTTQTKLACMSAMDSMKVTVNPKPSVTVTPSFGVCPHDTAVITAVDADPIAYYHWAPYQYLSDTTGPSVIVRPETDVTYTVVATNKYGCTDTASLSVTVKAGAVLTLNSGDSVILYPGDTYQLNPQTNCTFFTWFPPAGLSNSGISNPVATPEVSTLYKVTGVTDWGCTAQDSINIYVDINSLLALPNAFTPGNGPNNLFKIIVRGEATLKYFRIFDRWGNKVFETSDINAGWDGTLNGTPQPFAVYVYEISAVTSAGQSFVKHGNVTLIR